MNLLQKKRQAFRQSIRSKSIQQIFHKKRQQILLQLRSQIQCKIHQKSHQICYKKLNDISETQVHKVIQTKHFNSFLQLIITYSKPFSLEIQSILYHKIMSHINFDRLQKMELICRLIARKDFSINKCIQSNCDYLFLVQELLKVIQNHQSLKNQIVNFNSQNPINQQKFEKKKKLQSLVCYSLLKLWQLKPKYQIFSIVLKYYKSIYQKVFNIFGLSLITQLSYQKLLKPSYQLIKKILEQNINDTNQQRFFRIIQILKNFLIHLNIRNSDVHSRQIIYNFIDWIKNQTQIILLETQQDYYSFEIKYSLIYLLFNTLNKLFQINENEKLIYSTKEIFIKNEEIFNQKENHKTIKFLIQQGKKSFDSYHQRNIFNTLCYFISFFEISDLKKQTFLTEEEMYQIQKIFQGNQLNWFASFN